MQQVTPFLWFDGQAEEAANHYVSVFDDSSITDVARYPENTPGEAGTVMTVNFTVKGHEIAALNGGPEFKFTPAMSLLVHCQSQDEVDRYWAHLSDGGEPLPCGWVTDRFGVTWQIIPDRLSQLLADPDPDRANRAMQAMLKMGKIEIAEIEAAADSTAG
jgi:predicted 3-demethylubiquinone-9 3-methyltransferase (glyoxalase superfamily)